MEYLRINGMQKLGGTVEVHGAKNSVLPILAATLLIKGECVLRNCPVLSDVEYTLEILRWLGAGVKREGSTLIINTYSVGRTEVPETLMSEMRSSIIFLGALASRKREACLYLPGGCEIGLRPIDYHIRGLQQLGYTVDMKNDSICCDGACAHSDTVVLPFPSVGATENLILASVYLEGTTKIINAAREPEIEDLCDFLNKAGARIHGAATPVITVEGVKALHGTVHRIIPDRIMAGSYLCLAALSQSELFIRSIEASHLSPLLPLLADSGCKLYIEKRGIRLKPPSRLRRIKYLETRPYPGFPTDMQAPMMTMLSKAKGESVIKESIFENRFLHVPYLIRFGADIAVNDRMAMIHGVKALHACRARCTDLRGGMAVVMAALCAEGVSTVTDIYHIDRGYEKIEEQLKLIGADITRLNDEQEEQQPHTKQHPSAG